MSAFLGEMAGMEKVAARMKQVQVTIDTISASIKTFNRFGGYPTGLIPMATTLAIGAAQVASISKSIGDFKGAATGMDEVVDKPTLILAGEAGAEQVSITPLEGPNIEGPQSAPLNITFSGNVMSQDFLEQEALPQIKEALRRGADIGVS